MPEGLYVKCVRSANILLANLIGTNADSAQNGITPQKMAHFSASLPDACVLPNWQEVFKNFQAFDSLGFKFKHFINRWVGNTAIGHDGISQIGSP